MKYTLILTVLLVSGLVSCWYCESCSLAAAASPAPVGIPTTSALGNLTVHIIDVGQGDAILVRCPHESEEGSHEMLIDAASVQYSGSGRSFKRYLREHQGRDNPIELVVASHPHADHIGYMAWVLKNYDVDMYVDNGISYDSATYENTELAWENSWADYVNPFDFDPSDLDFCDAAEVRVEMLVPEGFGEEDDPNDNSVVIRLEYKDTSFLFTGDAERHLEKQLVDDPSTRERLDVDFLKVGHHGSHSSTTRSFLDAVSPSVATISCGLKDVSPNSRYKHPRLEQVRSLLGEVGAREGSHRTLKAFDSETRKWEDVHLNKALYVTAVDGDIVIESDGRTVKRRF